MYLLQLILTSVPLALCGRLSPCPSPSTVTELLRLNNTRLENLKILPNDHLLFGSLTSTSVYLLDPSTSPPVPKTIAILPGGTSLFGITPVSNSLYAIVSGNRSVTPHHYDEGSFLVHLVSPYDETLIKTIPVPEALWLNGLTTLPSHPHVILGADSVAGAILRIDTNSGDVVTSWSSPVLGYGNATEGILLGVNGVSIHRGYLYFTNSRLGTFSRVRINKDGFVPNGTEPEVLAVLEGWEDGEHLWDDFDFDAQGRVYVTAHPGSLVSVDKRGRQIIVLDGEDGTVDLEAPTGVGVDSEGVIWVVTMGGQILRVEV